MSKLKNIIISLSFSLCILFFGAVLIEIVLKVILPGHPLKNFQYAVDVSGLQQLSTLDGLVYELRPNVEKVTAIGDNVETYRNNNSGMRDYEYAVQKPKGVFRIACIGDSVTYGVGVSLEQTYCKILERFLNLRVNDGRRYEVLNFGVSGYNSLQEAIVVEKKAMKYNPDLMLVGVVLNDGSPTPSLEEVLGWGKKEERGYTSFPGKKWLQKHSFLYGEVAILGTNLFKYFAIWKNPVIYSFPTANFETLEEFPKETEEWKRVEKGLDQIIKICQRHGTKVLLAVFPLQIQLDYDPRRPPLGTLTLQDLRRPQEKLRKYAVLKKVMYVDLLQPLNSRRSKNNPLFVNDVTSHPNASGNEIAAESIFHLLESEIFIMANK